MVNFCSNCGEAQSATANFCSNCGHKHNASIKNESSPNEHLNTEKDQSIADIDGQTEDKPNSAIPTNEKEQFIPQKKSAATDTVTPKQIYTHKNPIVKRKKKKACKLPADLPKYAYIYIAMLFFIIMDIMLFYIVVAEVDNNCLNDAVTYTTYADATRYSDKTTYGADYYPKAWMITAGVFGIIFTIWQLYRMCLMHFVAGIRSMSQKQKRKVYIMASIISFAIFVMACFGFTIHDFMDVHCQKSAVGIGILCWSLFRFFASIGECVSMYLLYNRIY